MADSMLLGWTLQGAYTDRRDHPVAEPRALYLVHEEPSLEDDVASRREALNPVSRHWEGR